jgi:hypothetical protein
MQDHVTASNVLQKDTPRLRRLTRELAERYYGEKGLWAYDVFERINDTFFGGKLPWPHIVWGLTAHGGCLGLTRSGPAPVITLHPSLLGGTEKRNPWDVDEDWLGLAFAADVLLHETIHVHARYNLGWCPGQGFTSHNNEVWVAEVNRLLPLLGFEGVTAGLSATRRVIDPNGPPTKTGKPATKVVRSSGDGNLPHGAVARFPHEVRVHLGQADAYYRAGQVLATPAGGGSARKGRRRPRNG